jgi:hypothetical protein
MDKHQLKQRIDAFGKKLVTIGNDCMNTRTKSVQKCPTKHLNSSRSSHNSGFRILPLFDAQKQVAI